MGKPHYPWSVYVPKFFKQYYVVVIGFAVAGTLLCNLPKSGTYILENPLLHLTHALFLHYKQRRPDVNQVCIFLYIRLIADFVAEYAQQLDNWGKKDHGHGHGHGHH